MKTFSYILSLFLAFAIASCSSQGKLDRSKAPQAGPAPKLNIGQYQLATLDNGMKLIVVENHKLPRVSYSISLDIDPVLEGEKAGYTSMAGDLMSAGTSTRSKAQIDEAVDFIGASLSTSATNVSGGCLKKNADKLLEVMSDVLLNPTFPEDEIEKYRKKALSGLTNEKTDPDAMSAKITSVMNFGKSHPYGEVESEASIQNISREDLVKYYNQYFRPNVAYCVVVGDINFEEAKAQMNKYFSGWKKQDVATAAYKTPSAPSGNRVVFVPLQGAVQSVIDITYPVDIKPGTMDAITVGVLNNILGGSGFQTRLMQNLREDKAYTYGAYSSISADELIGYFSAGASVRNAVTDSAVHEILFEMERLVNEPVADSTLQTVKNIMTGNFARSLERPQTIANFALNIEKFKLPKDYYDTYLQKLNSITVADIQAMAKRVIKPGNANITVVGNKEVADKLSRFAASGKVELKNADGSDFVDLRPVPEGVTAKSILDAYVAAMGGADAFAKMTSYEMKGNMKMGPMSLDVMIKSKGNDKMKFVVTMGGNEMMKQVVNSGKGIMAQGPQKMEMGPEDMNDALRNADLLADAHPEKYGITPTLKGIDVLDGEDAYVVEMKEANGSVMTEYFSVKTGLLMKTVSSEGEGDKQMLTETVIREYASAGNIKYPSRIFQGAGADGMEFIYTEMKINAKIDDKEFSLE